MNGRHKRVRYWAMAAASGAFVSSAEVDRSAWFPANEALARLDPDRDRSILSNFLAESASSWPLILVRHATSGDRGRRRGGNAEHFLDERGRSQAAGLAPVLDAYGIRRILSAEVEQCVQTVAPYAAWSHLPVEVDPVFGENGYARDPDASTRRLRDLAQAGLPTAICGQARALPAMLAGLVRYFGFAPTVSVLEQGGYGVFHLSRDGRVGVVGFEYGPELAERTTRAG